MPTQLREAARRKDEFVATLAHELRNPLAPISNAIAIMKIAPRRRRRLRRRPRAWSSASSPTSCA